MRPLAALVTVLVVALAPEAWAQRNTRNVDPPIARSVGWFGYVGGDDIRAACQPGTRSHVRLIYNALWEEQVRAYDLFPQPDGSAGLEIGVLADQGNVATLSISSGADITNPWSMKKGQHLLSPVEGRDLMALLQASSAFGPPREGLRLPDNDFWWTVSSCRDGVWGFQAYHYPTDGFANVRYADRLWSFDNVRVPINKPRALEPAEFRRDFDRHSVQRGRGDRWMLVVGKDGLRPR
jgi:hypothetical protein